MKNCRSKRHEEGVFMETFIIHSPSVTYAQKGQKALEAHGIRARLTRLGAHGCAYGLEINVPYRIRALSVLEEEGILFSYK